MITKLQDQDLDYRPVIKGRFWSNRSFSRTFLPNWSHFW